NTLLFWEVTAAAAHRQALRLERRSGEVAVPGVSRDGRRVLFDRERELRVGSVPDGSTEGALRHPSQAGRVTTLALFSPDSQLIVTVGDPEGLQLWRSPTETTRPYEIRQLVGKGAPATCAAFAPDGSLLVTGMKGRQVLVWPMPAREQVQHLGEAEI